MLEDIKKIGEYLIEVLFQTVETRRGRIDTSACFHFCADRFQLVVELVAIFLFRTAGAPTGSVDRHHPYLRCWFRTGTTFDQGCSADERQFMVLLKKNDHAVRQLNAGWLLRSEF